MDFYIFYCYIQFYFHVLDFDARAFSFEGEFSGNLCFDLRN